MKLKKETFGVIIRNTPADSEFGIIKDVICPDESVVIVVGKSESREERMLEEEFDFLSLLENWKGAVPGPTPLSTILIGLAYRNFSLQEKVVQMESQQEKQQRQIDEFIGYTES